MSWGAWLAVIAGWTMVEVLFLAYKLDGLNARVRKLEAQRDLARLCRSGSPECPFLYRCFGDCEWGLR